MSFIKFKPIASHFNFFISIPPRELTQEELCYIDDHEKVIYAYKAKRDVVMFTDKRIVLIDVKGFRGFRRSVYAVKYESVSSYTLSINNLDSTLEIITDSAHHLVMNFYKPIPLDEVNRIYQYITDCVIKK